MPPDRSPGKALRETTTSFLRMSGKATWVNNHITSRPEEHPAMVRPERYEPID